MPAADVERIWTPNPGAAVAFLACPIYECLAHGPRGGAKTDTLLADFARDVGQGYGADWRGILFRQSYKQLSEIVVKTHKWWRRIFPGAQYLRHRTTWIFPDGEELLLRHAERAEDYWEYHGHEYPWQGWEELTTWPTLDLYESMKSCCRSSNPKVAQIKRIRSTTNPWGAGHNAVKSHFLDPVALESGAIIDAPSGQRTNVFFPLAENPHLVEADPDYVAQLQGITDPNKRKAWTGRTPAECWNITAGGMFDDLWDHDVHVVQPFAVPSSWRVSRAMDWGSSKPFSLGWWAESDGTTAGNGVNYPRGTLFRIAEWYGWNGHPNQGLRLTWHEVAQRAKDIERSDVLSAYAIRPGPADAPEGEDNVNIRDKMAGVGLRFTEPDKRAGSRKAGWERCREMLEASTRRPMEAPGIFVFSSCPQFIRTVPTVPRDLDHDPDDVDTDAEDHAADEFRYKVMERKQTVSVGRF